MTIIRQNSGNKYGRPFLSANKVPNGTLATIDLLPYQEKRDYGDGKGPKLITDIPVKLSVPVDGLTEYVWSAGQMATGLLADTWSTDENKWLGSTGRWNTAWEWRTKKRSGKAIALVPVSVESTVQQGTAASPPSPTTEEYRCPFPGCGFVSKVLSDYAAHLGGHGK